MTFHSNRSRRRGSSIVEFSLVAVEMMIVLLALIEFGRMVLVSTSVANSARAGIRYAIVHGATRTGSGVDGPSGPGAITNITANIKNYASAGLLSTSRLDININYLDGNNVPGSRIQVTVRYPYDPLTLLPLGVNLGSTATGVIAF